MGLWEWTYDIPADGDPGPFRDGVWVKQGGSFGAIGLNVLADFAACHILFGIILHIVPPVAFKECALHLPCTRVSCGRDRVFMGEHSFPYSCWHPHDAAFPP